MNAADQLEKLLAPGEVIESFVIGEWEGSPHLNPKKPPPYLFNCVLDYKEYRYMLGGWGVKTEHGGDNVYPVFAWSEKNVWLIEEYDGSTCWRRVPRNPEDMEPFTVGG